MKIIWKYPLESTGEQTIQMPIGADILSVHFQAGTLCLWALVTSDAAKEERCIRIVGTGLDCCNVLGAKYIGTVIQPVLPLVWHVFDAGTN